MATQMPPVVEPALWQARATAALKRTYTLLAEWLGRTPFHFFVSGSFRLGVAAADSDVDVVVVLPADRVSRERVFDEWVAALRTAGPDVTAVNPIVTARVPILELVVCDVSIDVGTVHVHVTPFPSRDAVLTTCAWLNGAKEACVLSSSGPRVTEYILKHAPHYPAFRHALCFLRTWAKARGVYSNKCGYWGGVNIALLLLHSARTITNPERAKDAAVLVRTFFDTYAAWKWQTDVVRFDAADVLPPPWLAAYDWLPDKSKANMTVLTPCVPRYNSTVSVTQCTLRTLRTEILRARDAEGDWVKLVEDHRALCCSRLIRIRLHSREDQWLGSVQAQTRHLVQYLFKQELGIVDFRHVPEWFRHAQNGGTVLDTYISADPDMKPRSYVLRGTLSGPLEYFCSAHVVGPQGRLSVEFVTPDETSFPRHRLVQATTAETSRDSPTHTPHARATRVPSEPSAAIVDLGVRRPRKPARPTPKAVRASAV